MTSFAEALRQLASALERGDRTMKALAAACDNAKLR